MNNPMRRLHALLAHTTRSGPEAEAAHRALKKLVAANPELRWVLDSERAAVIHREIECLTMAHRTLLIPIAGHYGCKLSFGTIEREGYHISIALLEGAEVIVDRCVSHYQENADRVDILSSCVATELVNAMGIGQRPPPDQNDQDENAQPEPPPGPLPGSIEMWHSQERRRMERMGMAIMNSNPAMIVKLSKRAAILLTPRREVPLLEDQ